MTSRTEVELVARPAGSADVPALARLYRLEIELQQLYARCFALRTGFDWEAYAAAKLEAGNTAVIVAEAGAELIGFIEIRWQAPAGDGKCGWLERWWRKPKGAGSPVSRHRSGYIEDLFIEESWRGAGCGAVLVDAGLRRLKEAGVADVVASIWPANEASLAFFGKQGFGMSRILVRREMDGRDQESISGRGV